MKRTSIVYLFCLLIGSANLNTTFAQTTAFTYQGFLTDNGGPANGLYGFAFEIFPVSDSGGPLAGITTSLPVNNGLFSVVLDFGNMFPGAERWLQIGVTPVGGGATTFLTPRQLITSTPYAVQAANAASASSVAATNISGTVSDARLSTNVPLLNGTNVFTGKLTSPKWKVTQVFAITNTAVPLPRTNTFASAGGTLVIAASGTAYNAIGGVKIGMNVILNGVTNGVCSIHANPANTHLAFCPVQFIVPNIPAGTNTMILSPLSGTSADANDVFFVTVTELPF